MARVLLVEDDDAIRTSLGKSLTAAGHVVTAVAAGADGVAVVARDRPDVLLLDRGSTGLGLDIARRVAETAGGRMTIGRNEVTLTLATL
jgi:two-component system, OmpR family, response regulator PrrA